MNRRLILLAIILLLSLSLACEVSFKQEEEPDLDATRIALQGKSDGSNPKSGADPNCDAISNVKDINYPDGSTVMPDETFNKTWSLQNSGTCTWTSGYSVALVSSLDYSIMEWYPLNQTVTPGSTANVTALVQAPNKEGIETYYYMLVNESGQVFGFGDNSDKPFWVTINVSGTAAAQSHDKAQVFDEVPDNKPCLRIGEVRDITVPDGTVIHTMEYRQKTWELTNGGTCNWTPDFAIALKSGHLLGAPAIPIKIKETVPPSGKVQVSILLVGPPQSGTHSGYWMMVDNTNRWFGVGENADQPFWVTIVVPEGAKQAEEPPSQDTREDTKPFKVVPMRPEFVFEGRCDGDNIVEYFVEFSIAPLQEEPLGRVEYYLSRAYIDQWDEISYTKYNYGSLGFNDIEPQAIIEWDTTYKPLDTHVYFCVDAYGGCIEPPAKLKVTCLEPDFLITDIELPNYAGEIGSCPMSIDLNMDITNTGSGNINYTWQIYEGGDVIWNSGSLQYHFPSPGKRKIITNAYLGSIKSGKNHQLDAIVVIEANDIFIRDYPIKIDCLN